MDDPSGTPQRILDIAERLVQTCGYNGFSYADIAAELKVTKASLHYHFPGKADLGASLIERYEHHFLAALAGIDEREKDARGKLRRYAAIYGEVLRDGRMCLCGMLAAEYATLPESMRTRLRHYFDENERWLAGVLKAGRKDGTLRSSGTPKETARTLVGSLEGAMMLARSYGDPSRYRAASARILAELGA